MNSLVLNHSREFRVEILYREPTYEMRAGRKAEPYRWVFRVRAESRATAINAATEEFRRLEASSSVSWVREIVDIRVLLDA
jgi:1,2-phenylacetyl-CoA epoxidase PaaB subunit